jgi:thiamine-phosphate pyrophosphorylase
VVFSRLTPILDAELAARGGWPLRDLATAYLNGGATLLQLRVKQLSSAFFLETAIEIVAIARSAGALVIVNDRADIARLSNADGVHVGQDDLSPSAVRTILGSTAVVGLSTHTFEQLDAAVEQPVTYVAIGPVFTTATKATGYDAIGVAMVREASSRAAARGLPLVAIGGITLEGAASVIEAGAASVAVISDLLATGNPEARTRDYLRRLASIPTFRSPPQ